MFVHQKENPQKPPTKVLKFKEELQATLENKKTITINFPINVCKRKNQIEEGGTSCLGMKREQESRNVRAQKNDER